MRRKEKASEQSGKGWLGEMSSKCNGNFSNLDCYNSDF